MYVSTVKGKKKANTLRHEALQASSIAFLQSNTQTLIMMSQRPFFSIATHKKIDICPSCEISYISFASFSFRHFISGRSHFPRSRFHPL